MPAVSPAPHARRILVVDDNLDVAQIMVVTGSGSDEDRQRSLAAGCDDHLLKPVDPAFLESLLGSARRF